MCRCRQSIAGIRAWAWLWGKSKADVPRRYPAMTWIVESLLCPTSSEATSARGLLTTGGVGLFPEDRCVGLVRVCHRHPYAERPKYRPTQCSHNRLSHRRSPSRCFAAKSPREVMQAPPVALVALLLVSRSRTSSRPRSQGMQAEAQISDILESLIGGRPCHHASRDSHDRFHDHRQITSSFPTQCYSSRSNAHHDATCGLTLPGFDGTADHLSDESRRTSDLLGLDAPTTRRQAYCEVTRVDVNKLGGSRTLSSRIMMVFELEQTRSLST